MPQLFGKNTALRNPAIDCPGESREVECDGDAARVAALLRGLRGLALLERRPVFRAAAGAGPGALREVEA